MSGRHASRAERRARGDRAPLKRGRLLVGDVDHRAQTIGGRVELARPGPCPYRLRAYNSLADEVLDGACTGEAGHLSRRHVDQFGRSWE